MIIPRFYTTTFGRVLYQEYTHQQLDECYTKILHNNILCFPGRESKNKRPVVITGISDWRLKGPHNIILLSSRYKGQYTISYSFHVS